jgi:hypothetical protein
MEYRRLRNLPRLRFLQSAMIWRRPQSVKTWRAAPLTHTILPGSEINLVIIVSRESKYPRQMAVLQQPGSRTQRVARTCVVQVRGSSGCSASKAADLKNGGLRYFAAMVQQNPARADAQVARS